MYANVDIIEFFEDRVLVVVLDTVSLFWFSSSAQTFKSSLHIVSQGANNQIKSHTKFTVIVTVHGGQFQHDIKDDSSMHIMSGNHNVIKSHHLDTVGCLPYQATSEVRDSNHTVPTDNLAPTTEQELQMEILSQAKRLKN